MSEILENGDIERITLSPGEVLFTKGDEARTAFLIEKGQIKIFEDADGEIINLGWIEAGEIIGEMSLIAKECRSASASAVTESVVVPIAPEKLQKKLAATDPLIRKILYASLKRLKKMNERVKSLQNTK